MINYASQNDLCKIAKCHIAAFPQSVTSLLGEKVVVSMLKWYLSAPNKFLFYLEENGIVIGYCGGFVIDDSEAYGSSSGMTQFGFNQAAVSFVFRPWLLFHPEVINKYNFILTNIIRKMGLKKETPISISQPKVEGEPLTAGLVVIGVIPTMQQKGLGTIIQQEFEAKARSMGAKRLLLTVKKSNERAIRSYQLNGYHIDKDEGSSYLMIKELK